MKLLPISLTEPTLARVRGLRQSVIRRPGSLLARCRPGDRLWVREPFHLPHAFDGVPDGFGRRRFARELPRAGHRMHLVLQAVSAGRLQDISEEEARAQGFRSCADFAGQWDLENSPARSITGDRIRWADNPLVTRLAFQPVFTALPAAAFASREKAAA